jgi:hypothetical protein
MYNLIYLRQFGLLFHSEVLHKAFILVVYHFTISVEKNGSTIAEECVGATVSWRLTVSASGCRNTHQYYSPSTSVRDRVRVTLRLTVSQSVYLGVGHGQSQSQSQSPCGWRSVSQYVFKSKSKSKLFCDWQSVNQYVLVSSPHWDLWPDVLFL